MAQRKPTAWLGYASILFLFVELTGAIIRRFNWRQPSQMRIAAIPKLHGLRAIAAGGGSRVIGHDAGKARLFPCGSVPLSAEKMRLFNRPIFDVPVAVL
jgi:hypothetical protein